MSFYRFLILVSPILFLGCLQTRSEMKEAEQRNVIKSQVANLQKDRAGSESRFQEIENDLRTFNGKVEEVEHKLEISNRESRADKEKYLDDQQKTADRLKHLEEAISALDQKLEIVKTEFAKMAVAEPPSKSKGSADKQSDKQGDKQKGPYSLAEEFFANKEWRDAILQYQQYIERWPKGSYVANATYKIGVCFAELGHAQEAKVFFEEVIAKFPGSSQAKSATTRLKPAKKKPN